MAVKIKQAGAQTGSVSEPDLGSIGTGVSASLRDAQEGTLRVPDETASRRIVDQANEIVRVTDETGRSLGIRRPDLLAEFRFVEAVGPTIAKNETWMQMAMAVIYLAELDGKPVSSPATKLQIEALIAKLGRAGYTAAIEGIKKLGGGTQDEAEKIKNS